MYKQQESLLELLKDVSRTLRRLDSEGHDERSASPVLAAGREMDLGKVTCSRGQSRSRARTLECSRVSRLGRVARV